MGSAIVTERQLVETAHALVGCGRGLLATDESNGTCNKRFAAAGIPQTEEHRRTYRELLVTTPRLSNCISGAFLYDETIRQRTDEGVPFATILTEARIIPGIKVDIGAKDMAGHPGETITGGLDGLRQRLADYWAMGARFAKWRAIISLEDGLPSRACIASNAEALAGRAAVCQEVGLVPTVEPEVLMAGDHDLERCRLVTQDVLHAVFAALYEQGVLLEGLILKPNMILPGLGCPLQPTAEVVAETTITTLLRVVPAAIAGIAFLSGGQSGELASARLNAMNIRAKASGSRVPWPLVSPSPAPFNADAGDLGRPGDQHRAPSRLCIIAPAAITPRCVATTPPTWRAPERAIPGPPRLHCAPRADRMVAVRSAYGTHRYPVDRDWRGRGESPRTLAAGHSFWACADEPVAPGARHLLACRAWSHGRSGCGSGGVELWLARGLDLLRNPSRST
jgi:fructose-bisphosphate aldolase class I